MAIFLDAQKNYRTLQRELPEGVYADGAPSGFFTTASVYAKSVVLESLYTNMEVIYNNMFPQTADEKQLDWERKAFGKTLDPALSLADRQALVLAKLKAKGGLSRDDMKGVVYSVIGADKDIEIASWGCSDGGWIIGDSELDISTILNGARQMDVTQFLFPGGDLCSTNHAQFGKTDAEWAIMQEGAYTYEVKIFSYTLTAEQRIELDEALSAAEPARSQHVITDGLDPADHLEGDS